MDNRIQSSCRPTRREILRLLAGGEKKTPAILAARFDMSKPSNVSPLCGASKTAGPDRQPFVEGNRSVQPQHYRGSGHIPGPWIWSIAPNKETSNKHETQLLFR